MKKTLVGLFVILLIATAFTACSPAGKSDNTASGEFKTIGDLMQAGDIEERQTCHTDDRYVYVYEQNGTFYRAEANLSGDAAAQLAELDIFDEDYEEKLAKIVSPLTIDRLENLSETIPTQEELDQWIGKTGKDLFDADWTNAGWNLDEMVFWMDYGAFQYDVIMEGEIKDPDNFSDEDINSLVVKSVTYNGQLGNATGNDE